MDMYAAVFIFFMDNVNALILYAKACDLLNEGQIKGFKIGSIWRISRKAINDYIGQMSGFSDDRGK